MKNRRFLIIGLVIMVTLVSTSCGVPGSEYDAVAVELDLVKQDRQALQAQLQEAQSQLIDARTDTVKAQVKLETTRGQLEITEADLETAQGQLQTAEADRQALQTQLQEAQSQLTATNSDLQDALAQLQSSQNDLDAALDIPALALSYAEFMDILMYEVWMASGVTPGFTFLTVGEYHAALRDRAAAIGDAQLMSFVVQLEAGPVDKNTLYFMCYYCLDKLETVLK